MYEFTVWRSARASSDFRVSALVQCRGGVHRASAGALPCDGLRRLWIGGAFGGVPSRLQAASSPNTIGTTF